MKANKYLIDYPDLMKEWDFKKNEELDLFPDKIAMASNKKVWWICSLGHSYDMRPATRSRGSGCPYCSGRRVLKGFNDLATKVPEALKYWDYEKNTISPEEVSSGSNELVWWKCDIGHSYDMTIHKRISRNLGSCPICSGHKTVPGVNDFATVYPEIAKEWHPTKNGDVTPDNISKKNGNKYWWQCKYGHEWQATPHDRADGTGCPECFRRFQTSFFEQAIFYYVKKLYPNTINRYKDIFDNGMELDVYVPDIMSTDDISVENLVQVADLRKAFKHYLVDHQDYTEQESELASVDMNDPYSASYIHQEYKAKGVFDGVEYNIYRCRTVFSMCGLYEFNDNDPFEFYMLIDLSTLDDETVASYKKATKRYVLAK